MTLPSESRIAERELLRQLAQFRHDVNAIGDDPSRAALERLIARAGELPETEIAEELAQLRACLEALDLKAALAAGRLPAAEAPLTVAPNHVCHFVGAVRFGRRRADQVGHLVLSESALQFCGSLDVSVAWSEIASVHWNGRQIIVALHDSPRMLRFTCASCSEAARGGVIAAHLAAHAQGDATRSSPPYHASA